MLGRAPGVKVEVRKTRLHRFSIGVATQRGSLDSKPKRFNDVKALVSLVRQAVSTTKAEYRQVLLVGSLTSTQVAAVQNHLTEFKIMATPPCLLGFLNICLQLERPTVVVTLGSSELVHVKMHDVLARALLSLNPKFEIELLKNFSKHLKDQSAELKDRSTSLHLPPIVVEEKIGRSTLLDLNTEALRRAKRRWVLPVKQSASKPRPLIELEQGWGVGAILSGPVRRLTDDPKSEFVIYDVKFDARSLDFSTCNHMAKLIIDIASSGSEQGDLKIVMSVPSPATGLLIAQLIRQMGWSKGDRDFRWADYLFGWQPILTLMDFCSAKARPAVFVSTANFPLVTVIAAI